MTITIFTIGFTGSSAEHFFERLKRAGVKKVIDTLLWASSQMAGFAKKKDLPYFIIELTGADYEYREDLAPTSDILKAYILRAIYAIRSIPSAALFAVKSRNGKMLIINHRIGSIR